VTDYTPIFRSPIRATKTSPAAPGLELIDQTGLPITLIQGQAAAGMLADYFGQIPANPGELVEVGEGFLARLTPAEFYLFGKSAGAALPTAAELESNFKTAGVFAHIVDYTHGQVALKLAGEHAGAALSKICALDFHDSAFPPLQVKQTSAAKIKTLIARIDEGGTPVYHLHVSRPLGQYFWETLLDAGQEFGLG
jgi:heterotetrameric sarcosine oxidase gamma subunit